MPPLSEDNDPEKREVGQITGLQTVQGGREGMWNILAFIYMYNGG